MSREKVSSRNELLVAILREKSDLAILQEQGWYRIPVDKAPKRWPPKWLAFYQPKAFGSDAYLVRYYGEVSDISIATRRELFPNELPSQKSAKTYYRLTLKRLEERTSPIPSLRPRRLVFVPTTWEKFCLAEQINDIFDDSPLEDHLWTELRQRKIKAERQWQVKVKQHYYQLDFAIFCHRGSIDIETDGDTWHAARERIPLDNQRDNDMQSLGWHVLRFNTKQIHEQAETNYVGQVEETINRLGGLTDDGIVPRIFYPLSHAEQLSMFEDASEFHLQESDPSDTD